MIAIFGKTVNPKNIDYIKETLRYLDELSLPYVIDEAYATLLRDEHQLALKANTYKHYDEVRNSIDVLFSLGGDGNHTGSHYLHTAQ